MHGVKRVRDSREAIEAKQQRERVKIDEYLALTQDMLARKKDRDWSRDALTLTTRLLHLNPEFYTTWNYRRNIFRLGIFPASSPEVINRLIVDDLAMTMVALRRYPKVYWIWNHRRWCLENAPNGPGAEGESSFAGWRREIWEKEMSVLEKMLEADPRNFHAWNYRRYILANSPVQRPDKYELAYTTRKIESSMSNFSAWHQRSKVLSSMWDSGELVPYKSREEEFELVMNAMYTDPDDQGIWMYHRWLVGSDADKTVIEREISVIQGLLDEQPDSKWCLESMVHYKRLLLERYGSEVDCEGLRGECREYVRRLTDLDGLRRGRYEEMLY